ncbi:MAG TPA: GNAT family N-acetyltransferase [Natronosporangium sp.]
MTEPAAATEPMAAVIAAHERRLPALDRWLPASHPLPEPDPADHRLRVAGGIGLIRRDRPDPDTFAASWGSADQHRLILRVGDADPPAALDALLAQANHHLRSLPDPLDHDSEVTLTWPSRDTAMSPVLLAHQLVPAAIIAARPAGRPSPEPADGVRIRPLTPDDIDAATELWLQELRWDSQFGAGVERPSSPRAFRSHVAGIAAREQPWAWLAEVDGQPQGLLVVDPPEHAAWVAPMTSLAPAAYLACLVVAAGKRGGGTGAALVRQAHAVLDAAGVAVTLLHYAALNPLSVPFWHRCGYRPLWTLWHARPAATLA